MNTQGIFKSNSDDQIEKFTSNQGQQSTIDQENRNIKNRQGFVNEIKNFEIGPINCTLIILLILSIVFIVFLSYAYHQSIQNYQIRNIQIHNQQIDLSQKNVSITNENIQNQQVNKNKKTKHRRKKVIKSKQKNNQKKTQATVVFSQKNIQNKLIDQYIKIINVDSIQKNVTLSNQEIQNPKQDLQPMQPLINQVQKNQQIISLNQTKTLNNIQSSSNQIKNSIGKICQNKKMIFRKSDQDDHLIRQRKQLQRRLKSKFQDTIYLSSKSNVSQKQYYDALQRMHIWKYVNPKTKELQILEQAICQVTTSIENSQQRQKTLQNIKKIMLEQQKQFQLKYNISRYMEIPFCIVIPSFNNADRYFKNLNSIMIQNYQAFHIVYIDDGSTDGTDVLVQQYIKKYSIPETKFKLIRNQVSKKALPNIDNAAKNHCNSGQIMAVIDGDDWLIGTHVFKIVNSRYQSQNLLSLYTNNIRINIPFYMKVGISRDYPQSVKINRTFRKHRSFLVQHLRTFYVDLYLKINQQDLKDQNGEFFTASNDVAILMPILQMCGKRYQYLPQLTYIYDAGTQYNNFRTKRKVQLANAIKINKREIYPLLQTKLQFEQKLEKKIQQFQRSKIVQKNKQQSKTEKEKHR